MSARRVHAADDGDIFRDHDEGEDRGHVNLNAWSNSSPATRKQVVDGQRPATLKPKTSSLRHPDLDDALLRHGVVHTTGGRRLGARRFAVLSEKSQEKRLADPVGWQRHVATDPAPLARSGAQTYNIMRGMGDPHHASFDYAAVRQTPDAVRQTGRAYDALPDFDPAAIPSYTAFRRDVNDQYDHATKTLGIRPEFVDHDPYPDVHHLINDVNANRRLKVLRSATTGGHPFLSNADNDRFRFCFAPGALVRTREGYTPIERVQEGDEVLSINGEWNRVRKAMVRQYDGDVVDLETNSTFGTVTATVDHPFWVLRGSHCTGRKTPCTPHVCARSYRGKPIDVEGNHRFDWMEAGDLAKGTWFPLTVDRLEQDLDSVSIPVEHHGKVGADGRRRSHGPITFQLTPEFLWILGLYIAEGSATGGDGRNKDSRTTIAFALHEDEVEFQNRIQTFAAENGWGSRVYQREGHHGVTVYVYSALLARWWPAWLGKGANNKRIPAELLRLPANKLTHLVQGVFDGDGRKKIGNIEQTSKTLALQLVEAGVRLGFQPTCGIAAKATDRHHEVYRVHEFVSTAHSVQQKKYTWRILGEDCRKITRTNRRHYSGPVYNLSVENHETYVVQNIPVHNCHDLFGHAATGRSFDRHGEQAAYLAHSRMFSPAAQGALASETRGQNASLILNGQFPRQKVALLPEYQQAQSPADNIPPRARGKAAATEEFPVTNKETEFVWSPRSNAYQDHLPTNMIVRNRMDPDYLSVLDQLSELEHEKADPLGFSKPYRPSRQEFHVPEHARPHRRTSAPRPRKDKPPKSDSPWMDKHGFTQDVLNRNALAWWDGLTPRQQHEASFWYPTYQKWAFETARRNGLHPHKGVATVAATSPARRFDGNLQDAHHLMTHYPHRPDSLKRLSGITGGKNRERAMRVIDAPDDPAAIRAALSVGDQSKGDARKISEFHDTGVDPEHGGAYNYADQPVVIDSWMPRGILVHPDQVAASTDPHQPDLVPDSLKGRQVRIAPKLNKATGKWESPGYRPATLRDVGEWAIRAAGGYDRMANALRHVAAQRDLPFTHIAQAGIWNGLGGTPNPDVPASHENGPLTHVTDPNALYDAQWAQTMHDNPMPDHSQLVHAARSHHVDDDWDHHHHAEPDFANDLADQEREIAEEEAIRRLLHGVSGESVAQQGEAMRDSISRTPPTTPPAPSGALPLNNPQPIPLDQAPGTTTARRLSHIEAVIDLEQAIAICAGMDDAEVGALEDAEGQNDSAIYDEGDESGDTGWGGIDRTSVIHHRFEDSAGRPGRFDDRNRATPYDVGTRVKLINPARVYYPQSGELVHDGGHQVYVRHDNGDVQAYEPNDIRADEEHDALEGQRWDTTDDGFAKSAAGESGVDAVDSSDRESVTAPPQIGEYDEEQTTATPSTGLTAQAPLSSIPSSETNANYDNSPRQSGQRSDQYSGGQRVPVPNSGTSMGTGAGVSQRGGNRNNRNRTAHPKDFDNLMGTSRNLSRVNLTAPPGPEIDPTEDVKIEHFSSMGALSFHFLPHESPEAAVQALLDHAGEHHPGLRDSAISQFPELFDLAKNGGFSVHDHIGDAPKSGYMVSFNEHPDQLHSADSVIPLHQMTPRHIEDFAARHAHQLVDPAVFLGGWLHNNHVYLDVSRHHPDLASAADTARKERQLGIYDLAHGRTIDTADAARLAGGLDRTGTRRRGGHTVRLAPHDWTRHVLGSPDDWEAFAIRQAAVGNFPGLSKPDPASLDDTGVTLGTHGSRVYQGPDHRWLVKSGPFDFLPQGELAANRLQRGSLLGTPLSYLAEDPANPQRTALLQRMVSGATNAFSAKSPPPDEISAGDLLELQKHHALDWLIGNHDAHGHQFIRTPSGGILGIDKGQAFKHYNTDRLAWDYHPNSVYGEAEPIYNSLYRNFANGGGFGANHDVPIYDPRQGHLADHIASLQETPDQDLEKLLTPYARGAAQAGMLGTAKDPHGGPQKFAPGSVSGFLSAVKKRRDSLADDMANLYDKALAHRESGVKTARLLRTAEAPPADLVPAQSQPDDLGSHGALLHVEPNSGQQWLIKPAGPGAGFLPDLEEGASRLAHDVGLSSSYARKAHINNSPATAVKWEPGAFQAFHKPPRLAELTPEDRLELQKHHAFDWLIANHDAHVGNFLRKPDGQLMGIDKGQAMKYLGQDRLDNTFHPNYYAREPIYNSLWRDFAANRPGEMLDPREGELGAFVNELQHYPDDKFRALFAPYAAKAAQSGLLATGAMKPGAPDPSRKLSPPSIPPNDPEAFLDALSKRKNNLAAELGEYYDRNATAREFAKNAPQFDPDEFGQRYRDILPGSSSSLGSGHVSPEKARDKLDHLIAEHPGTPQSRDLAKLRKHFFGSLADIEESIGIRELV